MTICKPGKSSAVLVLTGLTLAAEDSQRAFLKSKGVRIADDIDFVSLRESTEPVYSSNPDWSPGLDVRIQRILQK